MALQVQEFPQVLTDLPRCHVGGPEWVFILQEYRQGFKIHFLAFMLFLHIREKSSDQTLLALNIRRTPTLAP